MQTMKMMSCQYLWWYSLGQGSKFASSLCAGHYIYIYIYIYTHTDRLLSKEEFYDK